MHHCRGPVYCKPHEIGTLLQIYKRRRGAASSKGGKHSGPCGYKDKPSRRLSRVMADQVRARRSKRGTR